MTPLEFGTSDMKGNDGVFGQPAEWLWAMKGSGVSAVYDDKGYPKHPDCFFGVGWLVLFPKHPLTGTAESDFVVRFGVESPRHDDNATLNALKRDMVGAFIDSDFRAVILARGYGCDESFLRRTDVRMQESRNTTVFKVLPGESRSWSSPEEAITTVHADLGGAVEEVLASFKQQLNQYFRKWR